MNAVWCKSVVLVITLGPEIKTKVCHFGALFDNWWGLMKSSIPVKYDAIASNRVSIA